MCNVALVYPSKYRVSIGNLPGANDAVAVASARSSVDAQYVRCNVNEIIAAIWYDVIADIPNNVHVVITTKKLIVPRHHKGAVTAG